MSGAINRDVRGGPESFGMNGQNTGPSQLPGREAMLQPPADISTRGYDAILNGEFRRPPQPVEGLLFSHVGS
jgi:hypothetical protein